MLLPLLGLALIAPTLTFSGDSVYKQDKILTLDVKMEDEESSIGDLYFKETYIAGYAIYDNKETEYIDGLKFDGEFVTNWTVEDVDFSVEHEILIKTVYSDDIAGDLAATKAGDWSRILSNPENILKIVYYILATLSLVLGGFGLVKAKKAKVKTADEIATTVDAQASKSMASLEATAAKFLETIIKPTQDKLTKQNEAIIKALILLESKDPNAPLAVVNLLQEVSQDVTSGKMVEDIKVELQKALELAKQQKEESKKAIENIANGVFEDSNDMKGRSI